MEALFWGIIVLYSVGMFFFVILVAKWLVMWATKERAPKKPELKAPLYGHNILEWRVDDRIRFVELVKSVDGHSLVGSGGGIQKLKGWTEEGYVWGESEDIWRITPNTINMDAEKRKAQREAEQFRKSLERDAELAKLRAEEFQRQQSQS